MLVKPSIGNNSIGVVTGNLWSFFVFGGSDATKYH